MQVSIYSARDYERPFLQRALGSHHQVRWLAEALNPGTVALARARRPWLFSPVTWPPCPGWALHLGLDVDEHEKGFFFADHSRDPQLAALLDHPNVLIIGHRAFLTREAVANIATATAASLAACARNEPAAHEL